MNILVLSSRFPWPPFTGDRLRATIWLSALEREANVVLVAPPGEVPPDAPRFRFHPAPLSALRALEGVWRVLRGAPVQSLLAAPYDWSGAIERARSEVGELDATIVLLSRLDESVRRVLPNGLHVLDAIDSLRRSMGERSREASPLTRWFWRAEARRVARAEADAASRYDRVVVVSAEEASELGAVAVASGVVVAPLLDAPRSFDFGFWGRLAYFANADAAHWLLREIWPAVRAARPEATLVIGGADAPASLRAADGRDGVVVQSPVGDIAALARQVRVALLPLRYGTGQSGKVLEAAEGGCAVVATTMALRGFEPLAAHAVIAEEAGELARSALALVADERRRSALAAAMRSVVAARYGRGEALRRLAAIVHGCEAAA